ncbi:MAG: cupin domain-containing protein [Thermoleophilia bacterium]|nr:cupin domain-containing protein [Thermoleophilia bacterium]
MSRFIAEAEVERQDFEWGSAGMRVAPPSTGCETFVVMDVTLSPGFFHAFHHHPEQDELIIVKSGRVRQYLDRADRVLAAGDSVYIDKAVVHGSYNDFGETAELQVILAPPVGEGGYTAIDVSGEEPWASIR